jgi:hypothetical protein
MKTIGHVHIKGNIFVRVVLWGTTVFVRGVTFCAKT